VTSNLRDFRSGSFAAHNLEAIHPDDFISYRIGVDHAAVSIAVQRCRARLRNPPMTVDKHLNTLEAQSLPKTAAVLRPYPPIFCVSRFGLRHSLSQIQPLLGDLG
jgi:hypothetical protein